MRLTMNAFVTLQYEFDYSYLCELNGEKSSSSTMARTVVILFKLIIACYLLPGAALLLMESSRLGYSHCAAHCQLSPSIRRKRESQHSDRDLCRTSSTRWPSTYKSFNRPLSTMRTFREVYDHQCSALYRLWQQKLETLLNRFVCVCVCMCQQM